MLLLIQLLVAASTETAPKFEVEHLTHAMRIGPRVTRSAAHERDPVTAASSVALVRR